jgi:hypothetical protein
LGPARPGARRRVSAGCVSKSHSMTLRCVIPSWRVRGVAGQDACGQLSRTRPDEQSALRPHGGTRGR